MNGTVLPSSSSATTAATPRAGKPSSLASAGTRSGFPSGVVSGVIEGRDRSRAPARQQAGSRPDVQSEEPAEVRVRIARDARIREHDDRELEPDARRRVEARQVLAEADLVHRLLPGADHQRTPDRIERAAGADLEQAL